jgi:hypothetical protein
VLFVLHINECILFSSSARKGDKNCLRNNSMFDHAALTFPQLLLIICIFSEWGFHRRQQQFAPEYKSSSMSPCDDFFIRCFNRFTSSNEQHQTSRHWLFINFADFRSVIEFWLNQKTRQSAGQIRQLHLRQIHSSPFAHVFSDTLPIPTALISPAPFCVLSVNFFLCAAHRPFRLSCTRSHILAD